MGGDPIPTERPRARGARKAQSPSSAYSTRSMIWPMSAVLDPLAAIAQLARPAADHRADETWVVRGKGGRVGGHDQIAAGRNKRAGDRVGHAGGQLPAGHIDRLRADILELDPFIGIQFRRRVIHNLVDHKLARQIRRAGCGRRKKVGLQIVHPQPIRAIGGLNRTRRGEFGHDGRTIRLHQRQILAVVRESKIRVQRLARNTAVLVRRPHEQKAARRDRRGRELPFGQGKLVVGEIPVGQVAQACAWIVDFDPVTELAVVVDDRVGVLGHEFVDPRRGGDQAGGREAAGRGGPCRACGIDGPARGENTSLKRTSRKYRTRMCPRRRCPRSRKLSQPAAFVPASLSPQ